MFGVYLLPKTICRKLESLFSSFWWNKTHTRGLSWCSWNNMSWPKDLGGLGFHKLHFFNLAMLCKQGWRIIQNPESLVARVLKARYFPYTDFFHAGKGSYPSLIWSSILASRYLLQAGMIWRVGNGSTIQAWNDPWLPIPHEHRIQTQPPPGIANIKVEELILQDPKRWNSDLLHVLFEDRDVNAIMQIPLSIRDIPDHIGWQFTETGQYSVKSGYKLALQIQSLPSPPTSSLWRDC
ncbi:hypothetical protein IHE45_15G034600 [Dioscorea alata]|uniref:Uncharacterized protein n=1 Tax=Dioscorea alata TaxID=55571 RepID=A0ACB7UKL7_DIOAL|nr:hypothetical protein IHE45_15G034600 [Dioscorea alata]